MKKPTHTKEAPSTPLRELLDLSMTREMGSPLESWVHTWRDEGKSWRQIVFLIRDTTGRPVTETTLKSWFPK